MRQELDIYSHTFEAVQAQAANAVAAALPFKISKRYKISGYPNYWVSSVFLLITTNGQIAANSIF